MEVDFVEQLKSNLSTIYKGSNTKQDFINNTIMFTIQIKNYSETDIINSINQLTKQNGNYMVDSHTVIEDRGGNILAFTIIKKNGWLSVLFSYSFLIMIFSLLALFFLSFDIKEKMFSFGSSLFNATTISNPLSSSPIHKTK